MGCINSKGIEGGKPVHGSWRKSLKRLISSPEREDAEIKDVDESLGRESIDGGRKRLILELEENGVNPALFLHDNGNMKAETAFNEIKGPAVNKKWVSFDERADPVDHVLVSDDAGKKQRWQQQQQTLVISSVPNGAVSEHVVAGWPSWLTKVAGDAVKGWLPRKLDSFSNIEKIGQGTYSTVYQARDLVNDKIVALKKVRFVNLDPESVRFMAREIYVLRKLDHPNVIKLEGLVASRMSSSLWLVFQYMEHDLAGLAARPGIKFTLSQVKCFMKQLFDGLNHCHSNGVLHRDIKGANLLMNDDGVLKIADFGLATFFSNEPKHPLTSRVVTLWYRPPELLLGSQEYGVSVDLWSSGCILAELLSRKPIMPGRTEVEQLHMIFKLCGSPSEEYWRKSKLPHATVFKPQHPYKSNISQEFKDFPPPAVALLEILLAVDPADRGTSSSALKCEFFATEPIACDPSGLPKWPPSKEFDAKRRRDAEAGSRQRDSTKNGNDNGSERHVLKDTNGNPILDANAHLQISGENSGGSDTRNHPRGTAENGFVPVSRNPKANLQHAVPGIPSSKFSRLNSHCASWNQRSSLTNGRSARLSGLSGPIGSSLTSTNFPDQFCHPGHMAGSSHNQLDEARLFDKRSSSHRREVSGREPSAADQVPRRSRIAYSGPLMPAADNIDEMLREHERQIELAIRRACIERTKSRKHGARA